MMCVLRTIAFMVNIIILYHVTKYNSYIYNFISSASFYEEGVSNNFLPGPIISSLQSKGNIFDVAAMTHGEAHKFELEEDSSWNQSMKLTEICCILMPSRTIHSFKKR